MASLDALPEELQLLIIEYLDSPPPSSLKLRQEPSLTLTDSNAQTLKSLSVLSKRWRRLILPTLFTCIRLRLDTPPRANRACTHLCNEELIRVRGLPPSVSNEAEQYTPDTLAEVVATQAGRMPPSVPGELDQYHVDMVADAVAISNVRTSKTIAWIPRFYHVLLDLVQFLQLHDITKSVDNFILSTDQMLDEKLHRFPHAAADKDWRFPASAAFWAHLLAVIDPSVITIVAPPTEMACLTNCAIDTYGHWAFSDMDFHVLSVRQSKPSNRKTSTSLPTYSSLRPLPTTYPGIAPSSMLTLRPWTNLSLNEGSFLKAYSTYEYFEHGPPSLVHSIKDSIIRNHPQPQPDPAASGNMVPTKPLAHLTSLDYTAIFPFANHADFSPILHQLTNMSLQLAPAPESNILNDRARLGKADLADCWTELLTTYAELVEPLASVRRPIATTSFSNGPEGFHGDFTWDTARHDIGLRKLEALDFRIKAMHEELDDLFVPMCLPVWVESPEGVYRKMLPEQETTEKRPGDSRPAARIL